MADYISAPIPVDPDELKAQAFDYMRAKIEGWEPSDGNLDAWIIEAYGELVAQIGETASDVLTSIFRYFGANLIGIPPVNATQATGVTTWTLIDDSGYTIPEGATIAFESPGGDLVGFQTAESVEVAAGSTTAEVLVVAVQPGATGSGLTGDAQLIDPLDYVLSVALSGATSGGVDAEADDVYLNRLADELRLLSPRPILADDFATLARRVNGVARAVAIDNYIPGDPPETNAERAVYVVLADASGEPVSTSAAQEVDALLQAEREVNFIVNVGNADYSTIDVTFTATAWPDFTPADVEAAAVAALTNFLSPANWGQPTFGETRGWVNETTVRYLEVAQALNSVEGLRYVDSLTINGGTSDVVMSGAAPLPLPGTITGTVS